MKYIAVIYAGLSRQTRRWLGSEGPQLPGCMADGGSQDAALADANEAIQLCIDTAREFGDSIPEPKGERLMLS